MASLVEVLYPAPELRRTPLSLLRWWESRRLLYNEVVGATGLFTLVAVTAISAAPPVSSPPPLRLLVWGSVAYGVLANLCYSLGWLLELVARAVWQEQTPRLGPVLFREGLIFAVGLTLFPVLLVGLGWLLSVVAAIAG